MGVTFNPLQVPGSLENVDVTKVPGTSEYASLQPSDPLEKPADKTFPPVEPTAPSIHKVRPEKSSPLLQKSETVVPSETSQLLCPHPTAHPLKETPHTSHDYTTLDQGTKACEELPSVVKPFGGLAELGNTHRPCSLAQHVHKYITNKAEVVPEQATVHGYRRHRRYEPMPPVVMRFMGLTGPDPGGGAIGVSFNTLGSVYDTEMGKYLTCEAVVCEVQPRQCTF